MSCKTCSWWLASLPPFDLIWFSVCGAGMGVVDWHYCGDIPCKMWRTIIENMLHSSDMFLHMKLSHFLSLRKDLMISLRKQPVIRECWFQTVILTWTDPLTLTLWHCTLFNLILTAPRAKAESGSQYINFLFSRVLQNPEIMKSTENHPPWFNASTFWAKVRTRGGGGGYHKKNHDMNNLACT